MLAQAALREAGLNQPGLVLLAAVSGGADSLCMLHVLSRLAPGLGCEVVAAHYDHGLRDASADEAIRVAAIADSLRLRFVCERFATTNALPEGTISSEERARLVRYEFLGRAASATGAYSVAVAHTADDQAETLLMHLLRGSGTTGLAGMAPDSRPWGAEGPKLLRPLLRARRADTVGYCAAHGLSPVLDPSNEDLRFTRNRIRHELAPELATYNPAIIQALARTAEAVTGDRHLLEGIARRTLSEIALPSAPGEVCLDRAGWRRLDAAAQRWVLRECVTAVQGDARGLRWEHVEACRGLAERASGSGRRITLPGGLEFRVGYSTLRVGREGDAEPPSLPQIDAVLPLRAPGHTALGLQWCVEVGRTAGAAKVRPCEDEQSLLAPGLEDAGTDRRSAWKATIGSAWAGLELVLRPRRPGDRFCPAGMDGRSVTVKEYMIDRKVAQEARAGWPLLVGSNGIAWVCGLRLDERARAEPGSEAWEIRFLRTGAS